MFFIIKNNALGLVEGVVSTAWKAESQVVLNIIDRFFPNTLGNALTPPSNIVILRAELQQKAPYFSNMADAFLASLQAEKFAINIKNFGLADMMLDHKRKILYALSALIGFPSQTDPRERKVVWDVKKTNKSGEYFSTFSEHDGEAEYHTDSQYYPEPERYFLLYVVEAAACGGGVSFLRNGRMLKEQLLTTEEGCETIRILSETKIPFRIPSVFTKSGEGHAKEYTYATIFGENPFILWRKDTILKGLEDHPRFITDVVRRSLEYIDNMIKNSPGEHREFMPNDSLSIVDNHVVLHGRTGFKDVGRHLLRVRFNDISYREDMIKVKNEQIFS